MQTRGIGSFKTYGAALGLALLIVAAGCSKSEEAYSEASTRSAPLSADAMDKSLAAREFGAAPLHDGARAPGAERSVMRQANLGVDVENLDKAEKEMRAIVRSHGGYVDREEGFELASEHPRMHLIIRVPQKGFEETLLGFESLGRRTSKNVFASDLTEQILSAEARVQQLRNNPAVVNGALAKDEVAEARRVRDQLEAKAAMSTIDLTLDQRANAGFATAANSNWGSDAWNSALSSALGAFRIIGSIAIWLLAYSPIWGGLLVASIYGRRAFKRAAASRAQTA